MPQKYLLFDEFLDSQAREHRGLIYKIHKTVMVAHEEMKFDLSFNTPYYSCLDFLCYFGKIDKKGLEIGFAKGIFIKDESGLLDAKGRKYVKGITFRNMEDYLDKEDNFLEILQKAIIINESAVYPTFRDMVFKKKTNI